ncbi:hypothetical protein RKD30_003156 [Streptomyces pristinaespiralis]
MSSRSPPRSSAETPALAAHPFRRRPARCLMAALAPRTATTSNRTAATHIAAPNAPAVPPRSSETRNDPRPLSAGSTGSTAIADTSNWPTRAARSRAAQDRASRPTTPVRPTLFPMASAPS